MKKLHGKVVRREAFNGWSGEARVRLDLQGQGDKTRKMHLYVDATDPLADVPAGATVRVLVEA